MSRRGWTVCARVLVVVLAVLGAGTVAAVAAEGDMFTKLLVGHLPVTGHAKLFVAKEEGFFREEGLDVELVQYANSADGVGALCAGKLDVGAFGTVAPLVHIAGAAEIRIIGGVMGEDAYVVARPENLDALRTPADFRGRKIGTVRLSSSDAVMRGVLRRAGLSWRDDVQMVELSCPELVLEAVKNRHVDAGVVWGPHNLAAAADGLVVVVSTADLFPGHTCCRLVVRADALTEMRTVWPRFIRAVLRAERFVRETSNRERVLDAMARHLPMDRNMIAQALYQGRLNQSSDPNVSAIKAIWDIMVESGFIHSDVDPLEYVLVDLYRQALTELMQDEPGEPLWENMMREFEERNVFPFTEK